ncbi:hypothetical protein L9F63_001166 [Diploptera punctata]|uniref:F-actin-capping protein subunit alpha n=1 Tax=Diploptera punctata TaxID=6984 RepID=A0AAD8EIW6_DIPPU|nr:hypothetical protein L9F63_001166 [Diploptera punctata]
MAADKVRIVTNFILHSPPGELNEVLNDVRVLLNNDNLLKKGAYTAFAQYNKDQLTPVKIEGSGHKSLITEHNDLGEDRFFDDRSRQTFKYDHFKREASDYEQWTPDPAVEPWRSAIESELTAYTCNHFKNGVCSAFGKNQQGINTVLACIEDHQFQPNNYWNGKWCLQWCITLPQASVPAEIHGLLKVQVHYYEDGNVQLISSKEVKETLTCNSPRELAKEIVRLVESAESEYQCAISENYQTMSDITFKALRRQLPVSHSKIDWNKIVSYRVGKELCNQ